jgi:hypothetical protein
LLTACHKARVLVWAIVAAQFLYGCGGGSGGGGGGGGGISGPSLRPMPMSLSVSVAINGATPGDGTATFTASNLPADAQYIGGQYSTNGISNVSLGWNASGAVVAAVVYRVPGSLAPGTYQDNIQVYL